ncbi:hypothetical protein [Streptomyces daliensis]|uniref:Lipoprotein n=1 Tax=Streptomyces daliensis TaxID=299421 RepID=A0A8T4IWC9_9ACTN|nr:hypothetical protein [Streptomyces daliensis]
MRGPLRVAGAVGAVGVLVGGVVACEPVPGGLNSAAVALTTDQAGTRSLESAGVDVQWMSCTATVGQRGGSASASTSASSSAKARRQVAKVDCQGETKSGAEITVRGKVTEEHDGRCVRGDLTAKVGKRTVFRAEVLGNCAAPSASASASSSQSGSEPPEETGTGTPEPTVTETVTPTGTTSPTAPPETPPVTVTVTASPDPPPSDPSPDPPPPCECETPGQRDAGTGH